MTDIEHSTQDGESPEKGATTYTPSLATGIKLSVNGDTPSDKSPMDTQFEYVNTPEPTARFVGGSYPEITYTVDWKEREHPSPKDFETLSIAEVKLLVMSTDQPEHISEKIDQIYEEIVELRNMMMDHRGIEDQDDRAELALGDLTILPEVVDKTSRQVREGRDE